MNAYSDLFPSGFQPKPIEQALQQCCGDIPQHKKTLQLAMEFISQNAELLPQNMTKDSAAAIFLYTDHGDQKHTFCHSVNNLLCNRSSPELPKWLDFLWHLIVGVLALPTVVNRTLYLSMDQRDFEPKDYRQGSVFVWNSFVSCTTSEELARSCVQDKAIGVLFIINGKLGRVLPSKLFSNGNEVLLEPGSKFFVLNVKLDTACVVTLKQVASAFAPKYVTPPTKLILATSSAQLLSAQYANSQATPRSQASLSFCQSKSLTFDALKAWSNFQYDQALSLCHAALAENSTAIIPLLLIRIFIREKACLFSDIGRETLLTDLISKIKECPESACKEAHAIAQESATMPDLRASAHAILGSLYFWAIGVPKDDFEAARYFSLAASEGNLSSLYNLGVCYENGWGVEANPEKAMQLYIDAADRGNPTAQCNVGSFWQSGAGSTENLDLGFHYFELSANNGNAVAQFDLGLCYLHGTGTTVNAKLALHWFLLSATQGHAGSMFQAANMFSSKGCVVDKREAVRYYRLSAAQGFAQSKMALIRFCNAN